MVGMCPRTLFVLDVLIDSLHDFIANQSERNQTFFALSVFDGAHGFFDILTFTKNIVRKLICFLPICCCC
jgi:hypothetical protein